MVSKGGDGGCTMEVVVVVKHKRVEMVVRRVVVVVDPLEVVGHRGGKRVNLSQPIMGQA